MFPDQGKNTSSGFSFTFNFLAKKVQPQPTEFLLASNTRCLILFEPVITKIFQLYSRVLYVKMFAIFIHLPQQKSHQNFMTPKKFLFL